MPKFIDTKENKEIGRLSVIARYFRKEDETIAQFQDQCKKLTDDDKNELALGAAKLLPNIQIVMEQ